MSPRYEPSQEYLAAVESFFGKSAELQKNLSRTRGKRSRRRIKDSLSSLALQREAHLAVIMYRELGSAGDAWRAQRAAHQTWSEQVARLRDAHAQECARVASVNDARSRQYEGAMKHWSRQTGLKRRIVWNLRHRLDQDSGKLPWTLLPKSQMGNTGRRLELDRLRVRYPGETIDESRLHFARSLGPIDEYEGRDGWDGYHAFLYSRGRRKGAVSVLLESPIEGNAAYVLGQNWEKLSRLSKADLIASFPHKMIRVVHDGDWRVRIREAVQKIEPQAIVKTGT